MVCVTELTRLCIEESPGPMTGSVNEQGPGLLTGCQVNAVIYTAADIVQMPGADLALLKSEILTSIAQSNFVVVAG